MAEGQETERGASAVPEVSAPEVTPAEGAGTAPDPKPRSGFQRQKIKIARLTEAHEHLLADYDRLSASHEKLERDYAELDQAFGEVTKLNAELAAELRQSKQRPAPAHFGNLMGHP